MGQCGCSNDRLQCFCVNLLGAGLYDQFAVPKRPKYFVILADNLVFVVIGRYGSTLNRTLYLDRLAAEGMRFTDCHGNGPMCTTTRVALLAGTYQQRFGAIFDGLESWSEFRSFPELQTQFVTHGVT